MKDNLLTFLLYNAAARPFLLLLVCWHKYTHNTHTFTQPLTVHVCVILFMVMTVGALECRVCHTGHGHFFTLFIYCNLNNRFFCLYILIAIKAPDMWWYVDIYKRGAFIVVGCTHITHTHTNERRPMRTCVAWVEKQGFFSLSLHFIGSAMVDCEKCVKNVYFLLWHV